jgi:hypothetical protein
MPKIYINQPQVSDVWVVTTGTDGGEIDIGAVSIPLLIEQGEELAWLSAYNPDDLASPSPDNSRIIARAVLDALLAYRSQ